METKICVKCNREFPIENYCFKNKARNIRTARCTECNCESKRESYRKHYITNKKKFEDRRASFKASNYKLINSCKLKGCIICGEKEIACLDFHHLVDKELEVAKMANKSSKEAILNEISKCIVLCANCHRKLHAGIITL